MSDFVTTQLTAQDINKYWSEAQQVLAKWTAVKSTTNTQEIEQFRDELATATHGIETIEDYLEGQINDWKKRLGAAKLLIKDLKNHEEIAKRKYWNLRHAEPSNI